MGSQQMELSKLLNSLEVGTGIKCKLDCFQEHSSWFKCIVSFRETELQYRNFFQVNWLEKPFHNKWHIMINDSNKHLVQLLESDWDE